MVITDRQTGKSRGYGFVSCAAGGWGGVGEGEVGVTKGGGEIEDCGGRGARGGAGPRGSGFAVGGSA